MFVFFIQENLKRCVRDILSKKRMVAFLLLDSPQESIMDLMVPQSSSFIYHFLLNKENVSLMQLNVKLYSYRKHLFRAEMLNSPSTWIRFHSHSMSC